MRTVAYLAVAPEGRTHAEASGCATGAVPGLRTLTEAIHAEGAAASAQIGHAGPVANARSNQAPEPRAVEALQPAVDALHSRRDRDRSRAHHDGLRRAARLVEEAGFDAVEVHLGHNYLLSSFLSPEPQRPQGPVRRLAREPGRFSREIVRRASATPSAGDVAVTAKLNMVDGYPGGHEDRRQPRSSPTCSRRTAASTPSCSPAGSCYANPMFLFRGDAPLEEFADTLPWPMKIGFKLVRQEVHARPTRSRRPTSGRRPNGSSDSPRCHSSCWAASTTGRPSRWPRRGIRLRRDGPRPAARSRAHQKMQSGEQTEGQCIHCNRCMPTIYSGTRCILNDPDPIYPLVQR